jgi:hypothetical protein
MIPSEVPAGKSVVELTAPSLSLPHPSASLRRWRFVMLLPRERPRRNSIEKPLERARMELDLAPGFLVRGAPEPRRVVDRVGA